MRNLIFLGFISLNLISQGQNDWTKDDRNNLFQDYLSILTSHNELTKEQKETIALCCLESTATKYTKKEFSSKIEIEIKRINSSMLSQCSKNIGVNLEQAAPIIEEKVVQINSEWNKDDKEKIAKEFKGNLSKYESLSDEQIQTMTLCYINETTSKYTKERYIEMIDLELKHYQQLTINSCSRSNKIDLNQVVAKTPDKPSLSKEALFGTWKTDQGTTITFNANGTFLKTYSNNIVTQNFYRIVDQTSSGDWFMDANGILTLIENWQESELRLIGKTRIYTGKETGKYKFDTITKDFFKMVLIEGGFCCKEANKTPSPITQANKVM